MSKQPFDPLRAVFWLVAAIIGVMLFQMVLTPIACLVGILLRYAEFGACYRLGIYDLLRDAWQEMLTAILALLIAFRPPPPPSKDD